MTPRLQFLNRIKTGGITTPQAIFPQRAAPTPVKTIPPPKPVNNYQGPTAQVQSVQDALAKVRAKQQTYGVPGAK